jgi:hypothetical protein
MTSRDVAAIQAAASLRGDGDRARAQPAEAELFALREEPREQADGLVDDG